jgi:hypothetical protein
VFVIPFMIEVLLEFDVFDQIATEIPVAATAQPARNFGSRGVARPLSCEREKLPFVIGNSSFSGVRVPLAMAPLALACGPQHNAARPSLASGDALVR